MKKTFVLFAFCLAAHTLLCPFPAQARDQFIINYIDPSPEAIVTGEEMTAWLEADRAFAEAEAGLIDATRASSLSLPLLGVHPTLQSLGAQGAVVAAIVAVWLASRRKLAQAA